MKKIYFVLLLLQNQPFFSIFCYTKINSRVTFILNGGRLGDNLLNYIRMKYFSEIYNIPCLCPTFAYSEFFLLSKIEEKYDPQVDVEFNNILPINNDWEHLINNNNGTLYKITYRFKSKHGNGRNDKEFLRKIKQLIKPIKPHSLVKKNNKCINVALHIRFGSGCDITKPKPLLQKQYPTKFPPMSYYIEALEKMSELLDHRPIRAHIFTDAQNPEFLIRDLKQHFGHHKNILFSSRKNNQNADKQFVLEDFLSMASFDCLIRPTSALSIVSELIGNHHIVITPRNPVWIDNTLYISELHIKDKREGTSKN